MNYRQETIYRLYFTCRFCDQKTMIERTDYRPRCTSQYCSKQCQLNAQKLRRYQRRTNLPKDISSIPNSTPELG